MFELDKLKKWCKTHEIEVSEIARYLNNDIYLNKSITFYDLVYKENILYLIVKEEPLNPLFPKSKKIVPIIELKLLSDKWREVAPENLKKKIEIKLKVRAYWEENKK
jgi:hypothetical protein